MSASASSSHFYGVSSCPAFALSSHSYGVSSSYGASSLSRHAYDVSSCSVFGSSSASSSHAYGVSSCPAFGSCSATSSHAYGVSSCPAYSVSAMSSSVSSSPVKTKQKKVVSFARNFGSQPVQPEVPASTTEECDAQVSLRILIDREENRVLFAEAGKDFVDVLLSFLTLPLGTIARLVCKDSNVKPVKVGSLSSLCESVKNLDGKHFCTEICKDMLLQPRNSMEAYCRQLKLNIDDTDCTEYYICQNWNCSRRPSGALLSTSKNKRCSCGNMMNQMIALGNALNKGYVHETVAFIISDDLMILPDNLQTGIILLKSLGIVDMDVIGEMTVNVSRKEVLDLLKSSLLSKTTLTDIFLKKKELLENTEPQGQFPHFIRNEPDNNRHMNVKVIIRKSNEKILFAQVEEDFVDFLLSFLTFPLGGVEHMLEGNLCPGTLNKIYKSVADLHASRHFRSEEVKNLLLDPRIAEQFKLHTQILPINEASPSNFSCYSFSERSGFRGYLTPAREYSYDPKTNEVYAPLTLIDPKSSVAETSSPVGFVKGPAMYMVTDDLVVTPISSISAATLLSSLKIPLTDLEEREVSIGVKEGLSILKASLISSSALTTGLGPFIKTT